MPNTGPYGGRWEAADTCSCTPGRCHGGHTIDVGPSWVCLSDERLQQLRDDDIVCVQDWVRSMAAELLAARTRIAELEAKFGGHEIEGAEYAYRVNTPDGDGYHRYPADMREHAEREVAKLLEDPDLAGRVIAEERPILSWRALGEVHTDV
jgi:hypothetical protein